MTELLLNDDWRLQAFAAVVVISFLASVILGIVSFRDWLRRRRLAKLMRSSYQPGVRTLMQGMRTVRLDLEVTWACWIKLRESGLTVGKIAKDIGGRYWMLGNAVQNISHGPDPSTVDLSFVEVNESMYADADSPDNPTPENVVFDFDTGVLSRNEQVDHEVIDVTAPSFYY